MGIRLWRWIKRRWANPKSEKKGFLKFEDWIVWIGREREEPDEGGKEISIWGGVCVKCESKHRVKGESLRGGDGDDEFGWVLLCVHAPLLSLSVSLPLLLFSLEREREIRMFWSLGVALLLHYIPPCHGI